MIPLAWLLLSFLIGYIGRNKPPGFWGCFLIALIFSPLIGALGVAVIRDNPRRV